MLCLRDYKLNNTISEKMPLDIVPTIFLKNILKFNLISFKNNISKTKLIELLNVSVDTNALTSNNFPLKSKNLNKNRGVTVRKI